MPYYIYLDLSHPFSKDLRILWDKLKEKVVDGSISDLASLQYPPHVTISGSFKMDEKELKQLLSDVKQVFSESFSTHIENQKLFTSDKIYAYYFEWNELSMRVKKLKEMYPCLPWSTSGYHLTLVHGPMNKEIHTMKEAAKIIPFFPTLKNEFNVVVWRHTALKGMKFSWESRKWEIVSRIYLNNE